MTSHCLVFWRVTHINILKPARIRTDCSENLEGPVDLVSLDRNWSAGIAAGSVRVCSGRTVGSTC